MEEETQELLRRQREDTCMGAARKCGEHEEEDGHMGSSFKEKYLEAKQEAVFERERRASEVSSVLS